MAAIEIVSTALPRHCYNTADIRAGARKWLAGHPREQELFERCLSSSKIESRYFAIPLEEVLGLNGMAKRAEIFNEEATRLACASAEKALQTGRTRPAELGTLLFTSCSVPAIPSPDAALINALNLPITLTRVPMFQHGCGGGAVGLSLAGKFARQGKSAMLVSVELCSLVYQPGDLRGGNVVGSVLFGDGAATTVVSPAEEGLVFVDSRSLLIPGSSRLMGYEIMDDGWHLRLERELPACIADFAPGAIRDFLAARGLAVTDVKWWLFHPGGMKILQLLEQTIGLDPGQTRWAWEVLARHGNMSSTSILYVLGAFLRDKCHKTDDLVLVMGMGPGLSIELILLQFRGSCAV